MTSFLQAAGMTLLALILIMSLRSQGKDIGLMLSVFVCCALACLSAGYLYPVIAFLQRLQGLLSTDNEMLYILIKVVGIAFVSEIATLVCVDAGNGAMGKTLQFLAVAAILYLSLPILNALLDLIESILEKL